MALITSDCDATRAMEHQTALINSDCGTMRSMSIKCPNHLGLYALQSSR